MDAYILEYRPMLLSIAINLLGNIKDAEDMVQDTFVKWFERDTTHVVQSKGYLITTLKNACSNFSRSGKRQDEFKEDLIIEEKKTGFFPSDWFDFDLENDLAKSYATLSKRLNISEKSVYILREVFNLDYQEISSMLDKKAENCRKILDRAKERLTEQKERFQIEANKHAASFELFREACKTGKLSKYISNLKDEVLEKVR